MTTFKNSAKYGELMFEYLDLAFRDDSPLHILTVLRTFQWQFKGGSMREASQSTRLKPEVSDHVYPNGSTASIVAEWPHGPNALALRVILARRSRGKKRRALQAALGTWLLLTSKFGKTHGSPVVFSGMSAVYRVFGDVWEWAATARPSEEWDNLSKFTREFALGSSVASHMDVVTAERLQQTYHQLLKKTKVPALMQAVMEVKEILREINGKTVMNQARKMGRDEWERLQDLQWLPEYKRQRLSDLGSSALCIVMPLGGEAVRVSQRVLLYSTGKRRVALGMSDVERLHQILMSAMSCLVGCAAQAVIGTEEQRKYAERVLRVADSNIQRIVESSRRVPLGDEVLVCKGYRRAHTAHLGWLAGPYCADEMNALVKEAEETAAPGALDIQGYMRDLRTLDAEGALNAGKVFKICPAPDVSPGGAMLDRIKQIGDCNVFAPEVRDEFEAELRSQILRAYIRTPGVRLALRDRSRVPSWFREYKKGEYDGVPSLEIHEYLQWEGTSTMPVISPYDPSHWKDSGIGADTIMESEAYVTPQRKRNMLMRLLFDDTCPMPGSERMTREHVIKFFTKPEGHKDPARGIFSSNLLDRQAQSWMEKAVERVAQHHPSFMIGATSEVRDLREKELTARPIRQGWATLYYSFDISGWSAKMPGEPQRISHAIWGGIYGGHLFDRAALINEGAHIYVNVDGYYGWFKNTAANLEGFNGKEMTMVLVSLLSLSVRVWKREMKRDNIMPEHLIDEATALLFAYIDDGLSRLDLPQRYATVAFMAYKRCVIETFSKCGFTVETSKCFPSERFAIFLNEVYIGGRHVVHGVRAAMGICAEPTERHTTLVERVTTVSTGCRGAVMAGLDGFSGVLLLCFHVYHHLREWVPVNDAPLLASWVITPRAWGGLGLPNLLQMAVSGSGSAFEEGVASMQRFARVNRTVKVMFLTLCRTALAPRTALNVLTGPLSARVEHGYMVDSRVATAVREALIGRVRRGEVSAYARRLLKYGDTEGFVEYANAIIPIDEKEVLQEQMLVNAMEAHPHSIFSSFARRVEKSNTVSGIVGFREFPKLMVRAREEASTSYNVYRNRLRDASKGVPP